MIRYENSFESDDTYFGSAGNAIGESNHAPKRAPEKASTNMRIV